MRLPRIDPRLASELRKQRRAILAGLACVLVAAVLQVSTIELTKRSLERVEVLSVLAQAQRSGKGMGSSEQSKANDRARNAASKAAQAVREHGTPDRARVASLGLLAWLCVGVVGVFGARYWFTRGQFYYLSLAANRLSADLRKRMVAKLLRLPVSYHGQKRVGAVQSVLTNDVNVFQNAVGIIRDSIDGPVKVIGALGYLIWFQPRLALVAALMIPAMVAIIQRNSRKMKIAQRTVQEDLSTVSAVTQETLSGTRVVKAFGAEARVEGRYGDLVEKSFRSQMVAAKRTASLRPTVELIGAVALALFVYVSGVLASRNELGVSDIAALALALDQVNQGFRSIANIFNTMAGVQSAVDRIYTEVLAVPEAHEATGTRELANPVGKLEFRNVSFTYPDGTKALRDVSFTLEAGTSLALVGPSGAGKSTIADLVLRFYDATDGQILFDGVDVRELKPEWLRSQIGVVPQQTFLFAGTIEDNLRLGAPLATEAEIQSALRQAHADAFTAELASREESELGERGARLSGGQMQRVAIARALLRRPTLLLLDEATSALDAESEKAVTEALGEVMSTRTTLFIAHRLTTAARADRILVLSRGEVVEVGSHTELMAAGGAYSGLFRAFSQGVLD